MSYKSICISSGHGKFVKGADGTAHGGCDEVTEARRVTNRVAEELKRRGVAVTVFHDDTSKDQGTNLNTIVAAHNKAKRDLDVSVHFNASDSHQGHGVEVLYVSQKDLAAEVSAAIAKVGLTNRGAKFRDNLKFLNSTTAPAILLEVAFCDHRGDVELYQTAFDLICSNIADVLGGQLAGTRPEPPDEVDEIEPPETVTEPVEARVEINVEGDVAVFVNGHQVGSSPPIASEPPLLSDALFYAKGKCSHFGGPDDTTGVSDSEGLAFIYSVDDAPQLFLPFQPDGSTGLARRLNPYIHYVACRWNYQVTPKPTLLEDVALVRATKTGVALTAFPGDWGPNEKTGRVADLSPGLMDDLGIETDDEVEVVYPWRP